ncbi:MAG: sugar phosphate isomerase/epimerase [Acidobacteriia bacterium]|nr:sugar phosphate isomerase/epimerase [Terriglobia bacterium]
MNRRRFLGALAAASTLGRAQSKLPGPPRVRTGPLLCLDSRMVEIEYSQLGTVLNGLGFDGCDLSVQPGGTVAPDQSPVDLIRAIEIMSGNQLEVPVITTSFFSVAEAWARNVLGLSARSGVAFFRTGYANAASERLAQRKIDLIGLMSYGRAAGIGMALPYPAAEPVIRDLDPQWAGYDFDPSQGSIAAALPRTRIISLRDRKPDGTPCPLGEGKVDWPAFFGALAHARFSGPLTISISYPAEDRLGAIKNDLAFARQQLNAAYQKEVERS